MNPKQMQKNGQLKRSRMPQMRVLMRKSLLSTSPPELVKSSREFATNVRKFRAKLVPWLLFLASSRPLSFSCSPSASYFHFPFLLKILRTTPEEPAIRHAASYCGLNCILPSLCYRLTTYIGRVAQRWLKKFLDRGSYVGFVTRWFQLSSFFCLPPPSLAASVLRPLPCFICLPCCLWDCQI